MSCWGGLGVEKDARHHRHRFRSSRLVQVVVREEMDKADLPLGSFHQSYFTHSAPALAAAQLA